MNLPGGTPQRAPGTHFRGRGHSQVCCPACLPLELNLKVTPCFFFTLPDFERLLKIFLFLKIFFFFFNVDHF